MNSEPESAVRGVSDDSLYNLVEELTDRLQRQEPFDLEQALAEYPEHADRLRQVFPALEILAALGSHVGRGSLSAPPVVPGMSPQGASVHGTLGDFRILREIGRGGMGVVYEAEQISLDRRVALKVLPFAGIVDARQLQRFKNESRAAASLHHTNIVPVYAVGCDRGVHFYAMQYIEGQTLEAWLRNLRPAEATNAEATTLDCPPAGSESPSGVSRDTRPAARLSTQDMNLPVSHFRHVAELGIQAAEALDYAHQQGVVHRDIKPSNLILDGVGNLWIADFGLARMETDANLTMTGDMLGTLRYMSPEQAMARRPLIDHRTDIYSLGVTLYELLTLRPAFPQTDRRELLRHISDEEPARLRSLNKLIPPELETVVIKALQKEPIDRYGTAQELANDLRRVLEHRPILAKPPRIRDIAVKWARRHVTVVAGALVVTFICSIVLGMSTVFVLRERNAAQAAEHSRGLQAEQAHANLESAVQTVGRFLTNVSQESLFSTPGATKIRRQLLRDAAEQLESLCQSQDDPGLLLQAAVAFHQIGAIEIHLREFEASLAPLRRAGELLTACGAGSPDLKATALYQNEEALIGHNVATALWFLDKLEEAEAAIQQCLAVAEARQAEPPTLPQLERQAVLLRLRGQIRNSRQPRTGMIHGSSSMICEDLEHALKLTQARMAVEHKGYSALQFRLDECALLIDIAIVRSRMGETPVAIELLQQSSSKAHEVETDFLLGNQKRENAAQSHTIHDTDVPPPMSPLPFLQQCRWTNAQAQNFLGGIYLRSAMPAEARVAYQRAADLLEPMVKEFPDIWWVPNELATTLLGQAALVDSGSAANFWQRIELFDREHPEALTPNGLNQFAWQIVAWPNSGLAAERAAEFAQRAVKRTPSADNWSTLGVALYRTCRYADAVAALLESDRLFDGGSVSANGFFLTMAYWNLQQEDEARRWFDKSVEWMKKNQPLNDELRRFHAEAAELLGIQAPPTDNSAPGHTQPM